MLKMQETFWISRARRRHRVLSKSDSADSVMPVKKLPREEDLWEERDFIAIFKIQNSQTPFILNLSWKSLIYGEETAL